MSGLANNTFLTNNNAELDHTSFVDNLPPLSVWKRNYLYIFVFFAIYIEFGYSMLNGQLRGYIRMLILILLTIPLILSNANVKFPKRSILLFMLLTLLIIINVLRDGDLENNILLFIPIYFSFVTSTFIDGKHLIHVFCNLMLFLACFSLITYLLTLIAPNILRNLPILGYYGVSMKTVHNAFFSVCFPGAESPRNCGIAWEPGAFALLLCVAAFFEIVFTPKIHFIKVVIITATIITTFSTMGYLVLAGIYIIAMQKRNVEIQHSRKNVFLLVVLIAACVFLLWATMYDVAFSKLEGLLSDSSRGTAYTTQARINAIVFPFRAFLHSPIFGVGYSAFSIVNTVECNSVATNTIMNWFCLMGITFGLPCSFYYFRCVASGIRYLNLKPFASVILIVSSVLLISTESLLRISLVYILIFYGCQFVWNKEKSINNECSLHTRRI